ncbi:hypothetical protein [Marinobacter shengliensis]|uniref:Morphogenetic protein n=1 Tax=Marinobacter shengliensis TaxID=1389223 RepID=A0ABV4WBV6_9GAMM
MSNEKPILFNDDMIRAILEGRKTQTRRIAKNVVFDSRFRSKWKAVHKHTEVAIDTPPAMLGDVCPYGQLSDRLWVREAHAFVPMPAYRCSTGIYQKINPSDDYEACVYRENFDRARSFPWRPSIHMPRWASRITLEITGVRVERLQEISEEDARAEGVPGEKEAAAAGLDWYDKPRRAFRFLWQSINGPDSWDANPWVWVVEFKRVDQRGV